LDLLITSETEDESKVHFSSIPVLTYTLMGYAGKKQFSFETFAKRSVDRKRIRA
jgi:hypothetical protein